ncbi:MAG: hypothetical protein AAF569_00350 [Pseudomonadota bacterium]
MAGLGMHFHSAGELRIKEVIGEEPRTYNPHDLNGPDGVEAKLLRDSGLPPSLRGPKQGGPKAPTPYPKWNL